MSKSLSRTLYLIGLGVVIVATILLIAGLAGSTTGPGANGTTTITSVGNPALVGIAVFVYVVGGILSFIAYIGALIKTAMLGRWGWFVCLLLISGITMLVYIFAGPETRPVTQMAYPPQGYPQPGYPPPQGYPPQGYPQPGNPPAGYPQPGYPPPQGYPPQSGNPQSGNFPPPDYPSQ